MKRKSLSIDGPTDGPSPEQKAELDALAEKGGFTARRHPVSGAAPKVDGRKLRAKGRTKPFNMAVKPRTHARFWTMKAELGFDAGEDLLIHLMDSIERDAQ